MTKLNENKKDSSELSEFTDIFRLIRNTDHIVVIEITDLDAYTVSLHPYVSIDYKYISILKGEYRYTLSIINKDGTIALEFGWGEPNDRISDMTEFFKKVVLAFLKENNVNMELKRHKAISYCA